MYITNLCLNDFRNYKTLELQFGQNLNIIYGNNAQGKTNILEAIFICAFGKSYRTNRDNEIIRFGEQKYKISLEYKKRDIRTKIEISYTKNEKKKLKINEIPEKKLSSLVGRFNAVIFSPEDLLVIKEGPSNRRRYIDMALSQLKPSYLYTLQQYSKVIYQRNLVLKNMQENKKFSNTLDIWDLNIAELGSKIMLYRNEYIKKLNTFAKESHLKMTERSENLNIRYSPSIKITEMDDFNKLKNDFYNTLEKNRDKDLIMSATSYGPHKDDYIIEINDKNVKLYGSQGQQRSAVLSLKLAEIEIIKEIQEDYPVLLLDDVMSELDKTRQEFLLKDAGKIQTFITCTDRDIFSSNIHNNINYYYVTNGCVDTSVNL